MSSRCRPDRALALALACALAAPAPAPAQAARPVLRVCADPNNLPFSNRRGEGFENRLVALLARELGRRVEYTWWAQRRGFFRNTIREGRCDLVPGVPSALELVATTAPYYRSTYVFVYRRDAGIAVRSLDDPALRRLRIGVTLVGDDGANTPPAHALAARGIVSNVTGYNVYDDYRRPDPPSRVIEALARGEIDVAIVWGPLAGYFAPRQRVPLAIVPLSPAIDPPYLPFVFDIAMGVRRGDTTLLAAVDRVLREHRAEVTRILVEYGVPLVPAPGGA